MSKLELIRSLYDYNQYANDEVLAVASELSLEEFESTRGTSKDSVEGNLVHIVAAQRVWLARWIKGGNPLPMAQAQAVHGLGAIRNEFERSHSDLREFLAGLTDERLDRPLAYKDSAGNPYEQLLWRLMLHVANHGSYHRAETAMALTALGHSPGDLDYVYFEVAREAGRRR